MHFRFKADATFEAEDIKDAFVKLATHFLALHEEIDKTGLGQIGSMTISKEPSQIAQKTRW